MGASHKQDWQLVHLCLFPIWTIVEMRAGKFHQCLCIINVVDSVLFKPGPEPLNLQLRVQSHLFYIFSLETHKNGYSVTQNYCHMFFNEKILILQWDWLGELEHFPIHPHLVLMKIFSWVPAYTYNSLPYASRKEAKYLKSILYPQLAHGIFHKKVHFPYHLKFILMQSIAKTTHSLGRTRDTLRVVDGCLSLYLLL